MTKSKKQFATKQAQDTGEDFHQQVEMAFGDHPWPASRSELLEHASRQHVFAKSDLARLKQIPHRDYHSAKDLVDATRQTTASVAQSAGPVASADHNRRAMGEATAGAPMPSTASTASYDEQMR